LRTASVLTPARPATSAVVRKSSGGRLIEVVDAQHAHRCRSATRGGVGTRQTQPESLARMEKGRTQLRGGGLRAGWQDGAAGARAGARSLRSAGDHGRERDGRLPSQVDQRRPEQYEDLGDGVERERLERGGELAELGDGGVRPAATAPRVTSASMPGPLPQRTPVRHVRPSSGATRRIGSVEN